MVATPTFAPSSDSNSASNASISRLESIKAASAASASASASATTFLSACEVIACSKTPSSVMTILLSLVTSSISP